MFLMRSASVGGKRFGSHEGQQILGFMLICPPPVKVYKYTFESICQSMCVFLWVLMHFLNCFKTCTLGWFIFFITDVLTAASRFFQQGQGQNCMMQPLLPYLIVLSCLSPFLIGQMFLREPSWFLTG